MRVFLVSILIILLTVFYWNEFESLRRFQQLASSGEPLAVKDLLLLSFGFLLLIESAYLAFRRKEPQTQLPAQNVDSKEVEELRLALKDANARLAEAEKQEALKARPEAVTAEVLHLLSLLQDKGRLIDFLMDDVSPYSDQQVGAAARVVHQGCSELLKKYFSIQPIHQGNEGEELRLEKSFNPKEFRLLGSLHGEPPFQGKVVHRGWRAGSVSLPRLSETASTEDASIIAPTQVQLS